MESTLYLQNSSSTNSTPTVLPQGQTPEVIDHPHVVIICTILGVASLVGTLGNALVLWSIMKFENLRTIADLFIFSLSLSDILVTTTYQPLKAYRAAQLQEANLSLVFFSRFLGYLSLTASITNMFGVTVERLISIRFPLKYDQIVTRRRAIITVIYIWVFSVTNGIIYSRGYMSGFYLAMYFILTIAGIGMIYAYIFYIAKRLEDVVIQAQNRFVGGSERKAAKTIIILLEVAIACWVPFLISLKLLSKNDVRSKWIFYLAQALATCNSSINPYIYCVRSSRYRKAFVKLLGLRKVVDIARETWTPAYLRNTDMNEFQLNGSIKGGVFTISK